MNVLRKITNKTKRVLSVRTDLRRSEEPELTLCLSNTYDIVVFGVMLKKRNAASDNNNSNKKCDNADENLKMMYLQVSDEAMMDVTRSIVVEFISPGVAMGFKLFGAVLFPVKDSVRSC